MALIKNKIPILEYDPSQTAVFMPGSERNFPEYAVFPFLADEVEKFVKQENARQIGSYISATKVFPICEIEYGGRPVCLCQAPVGSAPAVQLLDYLIGNGCSKIISAGSCGALQPFDENEFLIPTEALRCEGASYHYLPPSRTVKQNPAAVSAIERRCAKIISATKPVKPGRRMDFTERQRTWWSTERRRDFRWWKWNALLCLPARSSETQCSGSFCLPPIPWPTATRIWNGAGDFSHFPLP